MKIWMKAWLTLVILGAMFDQVLRMIGAPRVPYEGEWFYFGWAMLAIYAVNTVLMWKDL